jgi:hypothetical protein
MIFVEGDTNVHLLHSYHLDRFSNTLFRKGNNNNNNNPKTKPQTNNKNAHTQNPKKQQEQKKSSFNLILCFNKTVNQNFKNIDQKKYSCYSFT